MEPNTLLVDRYRIRKKLSQKAGRQTFLADDLQSYNLVVIKILQFNLDFHWDDLKLFERETQTLQNLNHRSIPTYLDHFELDIGDIHGFALVQTYIDAPSLQSTIESGRKFSEPEIIKLADRLLTIITYLHEQIPPVIHRDIKPSNILITSSKYKLGKIYLVDFGSVQVTAGKDSGTRTIVGSYGYMPLEQFGGQTTVASDLYSLGMTLIYLITGTHPAELSQQNGRVKFDAEISNKLMKWLEKITQPYPDLRFDSACSAQKSLNSNQIETDNSFSRLDRTEAQVKIRRNNKRSKVKRISIKFKKQFRTLIKSTSKLIEGTLDIIIGLLVVLSIPGSLWAVFFEMRGLINFSLTTIAKLLSIEHYSIISALIHWSEDNTLYIIGWMQMIMCSVIAFYPVLGLLAIGGGLVNTSLILGSVFLCGMLIMIFPFIVLLISPILPLALPLIILGIYTEVKKILFPKP